ncbi:MAG TPA: hypothetical protein PLD84_01930 [Chitinophagales bacterium]|nr:hypothetical protein [Chitinophagales bacterium]
MKYLLFLIFLSAEKSCDVKDQLPLIKATSQAWSGGAAGSGRGTYYNIYLGLKNTSDYTFDSLWVQERRLPVTIKENKTAGDTLLLTVNDMTQTIRNIGDLNKPVEDVVPVPFPITAKAEAVLGYHYKGKQKYLLIESWTKLKPLYYP